VIPFNVKQYALLSVEPTIISKTLSLFTSTIAGEDNTQ